MPAKRLYQGCMIGGIVASAFALREGFFVHQCGMVSLLLHHALVEFEVEGTYDTWLIEVRDETLLRWCDYSPVVKLMIDLPLTLFGSGVLIALFHVPIFGLFVLLDYVYILLVKPFVFNKLDRFLTMYETWQNRARWNPAGPVFVSLVATSMVGLSHFIPIYAYNEPAATILFHTLFLVAALYKTQPDCAFNTRRLKPRGSDHEAAIRRHAVVSLPTPRRNKLYQVLVQSESKETNSTSAILQSLKEDSV